jgi:hypothetical protein
MMLGIAVADEEGCMTEVGPHSDWLMASSGGREFSWSMVGGTEQGGSAPYIEVSLYCCSTIPGDG